MNIMQLAAIFAALASTQRLQILAELSHGRVHVSQLARCVNMSRALLYMHLAKLEAAGFVTSSLELSPEGTALKHIELTPFALVVDIDTICQAAGAEINTKTPHKKEEK